MSAQENSQAVTEQLNRQIDTLLRENRGYQEQLVATRKSATDFATQFSQLVHAIRTQDQAYIDGVLAQAEENARRQIEQREEELQRMKDQLGLPATATDAAAVNGVVPAPVVRTRSRGPIEQN